MASLSAYIIILVVILAIIILISIIAYNRRLDRIARGEQRDDHTVIPEPKETISGAYKILNLGILIICFVTISTMNGRINSMQNDIRNMQYSIHGLQNTLYAMQQEQIDQTKRIASLTWGIEDTDYQNKTARLYFDVVLKEYTADTTVSVKYAGQEVELVSDQKGSYSAEFETSLFGPYEEVLYLIREDGKTTVETGDVLGGFFHECMPVPSYECTFSSRTSGGKLKYDGEFMLVCDHTDQIEKVTLTYMSDGKELKTMDYTSQVVNRKKTTLEQGLDIGKDLTFRTEITTKAGYRIVSQDVMIYEAGPEMVTENYLRIYDSAGTLVWDESEK